MRMRLKEAERVWWTCIATKTDTFGKLNEWCWSWKAHQEADEWTREVLPYISWYGQQTNTGPCDPCTRPLPWPVTTTASPRTMTRLHHYSHHSNLLLLNSYESQMPTKAPASLWDMQTACIGCSVLHIFVDITVLHIFVDHQVLHIFVDHPVLHIFVDHPVLHISVDYLVLNFSIDHPFLHIDHPVVHFSVDHPVLQFSVDYPALHISAGKE